MDEFSRDSVIDQSLATIETQIRMYSVAAGALVAVGVVTAVWGVFQFSASPEDLSRLGGFLSGAVTALWSLAGLLLIYVAFLGQRRQILHQEEELSLNRIELQHTREELRGQKEQLEQQTVTSRQQRFENTFFQRLNVLNAIIGSFRLQGVTVQVGPKVIVQNASGREVFRAIAEELQAREDLESPSVDASPSPSNAWKELCQRHEPLLSQYYRTLTHVIGFVHRSGQPEAERRDHVNAIRAQLSRYELELLLRVCVNEPDAGELRALVEEYGLLRFLGTDGHFRQRISPRAFMDMDISS